MKYLKIILSHLKTACVYFTVSQLFITALFQITAKNGAEGRFLLFDVELVLLGFSVVMSVVQDVFGIKKLSFGVRLIIHFLLTMAALFLLFRIVTGQIANTRSVILMMAICAVIYAVFAAVLIIVRVFRKKKDDENKEYKSMFSDEKKK